MAVIREYTVPEGRLSAGARITVRDDCYAGIGAEELARRREAIARIIRKIDMDAQAREREENNP